MKIPISNALEIKNKVDKEKINKNLLKLNNLNFEFPKKNFFPLLDIINLIPEKSSYFETILTTLNDILVKKYLKGELNYLSLQLNILKFLKKPYFIKYYKLKPKNIYDIKKVIIMTKNYVETNYKNYGN